MKIPTQKFGETRSGKAICAYTTDDAATVAKLIADFSPSDYFDAMALFQYLAIRELRRNGRHTTDFHRYEWYEVYHAEALGKTNQYAQMRVLSLVTSFDIVDYGKSRADHLFVD
jgi:hypothetical protein